MGLIPEIFVQLTLCHLGVCHKCNSHEFLRNRGRQKLRKFSILIEGDTVNLIV